MIRFSPFEVDLEKRVLRRNGRPIRVQDHPFRVLAALLERPGEEVSRERLRELLWPDKPFVDAEAGINTAVRKLREALDDDAERPRFVETRPRHGYRFIAEVERVESTPAAEIVPQPTAEVRAGETARRNSARRPRGALTVAAIAVATVGVLALFVEWRARDERIEANLAPPPANRFTGELALSPDGAWIVLVATEDGTPEARLWLGSTRQPGLKALPGTQGGALPFWAPDGSAIAFFAAGELRRIDLASEQVSTICAAPRGRGGTWLADGTILFAPEIDTPIFRVGAAGGAIEPVTELGDAPSHRFPVALPDGRSFVYLALREDRSRSELRWGELGTRRAGTVSNAVSNASYVPPGWLLFSRGRSLLAQRFDSAAKQVSGPALVIADRITVVSEEGPTGLATFSASADGLLATAELRLPSRRLRWLDRSGRDLGAVGPAGTYAGLDLDTQRGRVALLRYDDRSTTGDLVLLDLERETVSLVTNDPWPDAEPRLSADGAEVAFLSLREGAWRAYVRRVDRGSEERALPGGGWSHLYGWLPGRRALLVERRDPQTGADLWSLPLAGDEAPRPLVAEPGDQTEAALSPDGKWLAWMSISEDGGRELRVRRFGEQAGKDIRLEAAGGSAIRWRDDSRELYLVAGTRLSAVPWDAAGADVPQRPELLFEAPALRPGGVSDFAPAFAADSTGDRFLVIDAEPAGAPPPIRLLRDWRHELERLGLER